MADGERRRAPLWPIRTASTGGINASISGTVNYLRFYLAGGQFNGTRLLSPGIIRAMQTPRVHACRTEFGEGGDYTHDGLGLECYHFRGERVVGHWRLDWLEHAHDHATGPPSRLCDPQLTNRDPSPVREILAYAVLDRVCGKDPIPWLDRFR